MWTRPSFHPQEARANPLNPNPDVYVSIFYLSIYIPVYLCLFLYYIAYGLTLSRFHSQGASDSTGQDADICIYIFICIYLSIYLYICLTVSIYHTPVYIYLSREPWVNPRCIYLSILYIPVYLSISIYRAPIQISITWSRPRFHSQGASDSAGQECVNTLVKESEDRAGEVSYL